MAGQAALERIAEPLLRARAALRAEYATGIALRDQSGNLRRSEDLLADVADAFARIEDPRSGCGSRSSCSPPKAWLWSTCSAAAAMRESPTLGFRTFLDTAQINALERKLDELRRARDQTQARIAFLEGAPDTGAPAPASAPAPDDTAGMQDRAKSLERIAPELEGTLFSITHQGSARIIAEHERRVAEIAALRARDGSNAQQVDRLVVPPERVVREDKTAREQRPITVVVNVTAADASSFRASQGQIAADMARAIDRASRDR